MRQFEVWEEMHIDKTGRKHKRRQLGVIEARNIGSAANKARRQFRKDEFGIKRTTGSLIVWGRHPKTGTYEEKII